MVRCHCCLLLNLFGPPKFAKVWHIWQVWKVQCRFGIKVYKGVQFGPLFLFILLYFAKLKSLEVWNQFKPTTNDHIFLFIIFKKFDFFSIGLNVKFFKWHIQHQSKLAKCPFWKKCYWLLINYLQRNNSKLSKLFINE
jgi:hypothetical protein